MKDRTTIQIPKELQRDLKKLKRYKRETYEEIIRKLMKKKEAKRKIKAVVREAMK
jgi:predicted CopG family antitoxin